MAMQGTLKILVRKLSSATENEETLECYSQCYRVHLPYMQVSPSHSSCAPKGAQRAAWHRIC